MADVFSVLLCGLHSLLPPYLPIMPILLHIFTWNSVCCLFWSDVFELVCVFVGVCSKREDESMTYFHFSVLSFF